MTSILIDRLDGLSSAAAIKGPCKVATTTNITLSGLQTIDGVSVVANDRVLVKSQTTGSQNGIYVADTGPWRRAKDFSRTKDVVTGTQVLVTHGTNANSMYAVATANPIVIGTTAIVFDLLDRFRRTLTSFGAAGDGTTIDDAALNAALAAGVPLTGAGLTYGVNGNLSIPAGTDLEDATFKQLDHNDPNRKTLYANGVNNVRLVRVKVDRNGDGTGGGLSTAAGIWIQGGEGHHLEDCEAYGADKGSGIVFSGASDFKLIRPYVHDITYTAAVLPSDDLAQGIMILAGINFEVVDPRIEHVGGIVAGNFRRAFGRMMPIGLGSRDYKIIGGNLSDGDVGLDLTGSIGNHRFSVIGLVVKDVETWGVKVSNYNRFGKIIGCHVYRAGSAGFVGSGPTVNVDPDTTVPEMLPQMVDFISCGAWDTGYGNTGRGTSQPAGFLIIPGAASSYQDYPRGYRVINSDAVDNQAVKTQYHGFRNEISFGGAPLNEVINCRSDGYAVGGGHSTGWHYPAASANRTSTQSLTNATATTIDLDLDVFDGAAMHSTVTNNSTIFVPRPGSYRIDAAVRFDENATGQRVLQIFVGGVAQSHLVAVQPGVASGDTTCVINGLVYIGDVTGGISMKAQQNSGGSLNVTYAILTVSEGMPYSS